VVAGLRFADIFKIIIECKNEENNSIYIKNIAKKKNDEKKE
jgi:hypothetical protein